MVSSINTAVYGADQMGGMNPVTCLFLASLKHLMVLLHESRASHQFQRILIAYRAIQLQIFKSAETLLNNAGLKLSVIFYALSYCGKMNIIKK